MLTRLRRRSRPLLAVICWVAFAWIPWALVAWISRPFADDDNYAIARAAVGSVVVGACLSAVALRGKEFFGWVQVNWARGLGQLLGLVAAVLLAGNAVVVLLDLHTAGWTAVLVCAALATVVYTVILAVAAFWPMAAAAAASRFFASLAIHRASLGPIAISVAGSLILILSAETWVSNDQNLWMVLGLVT